MLTNQSRITSTSVWHFFLARPSSITPVLYQEELSSSPCKHRQNIEHLNLIRYIQAQSSDSSRFLIWSISQINCNECIYFSEFIISYYFTFNTQISRFFLSFSRIYQAGFSDVPSVRGVAKKPNGSRTMFGGKHRVGSCTKL